MKKSLVVTLATVAVLLAALPVRAVTEQSWRWKKCQFQSWNRNPGYTTTEVRLTIRCANEHWRVPGGLPMAFCIADRESGFYPKAQNPSSSAAGIFQVVQGTWDSWYSAMPDVRHWFRIGYDRLNPRNNIIVSVRKMSHEGLAPWGGGC